MTNVYDKGDKVRIGASFTLDDTMTDPSNPYIQVKDPSGNIESASTACAGDGWTKNADGDFHFDVTLDESGMWHYRWSGSGDVVAATTGHFSVRETEF